MCWKGKYKPIIAKNNISIYKIMLREFIDPTHSRIVSYYQGFPYILNVKVVEELPTHYIPDNMGYVRITKALHSYSKEYTRLEKYSTGFLVKSNLIDSSLDFYTFDRRGTLIMDGFIPKGATYCMNEYGEIISNELILTHEK